MKAQPELKTRAVLGSLQFITDTARPDIATATSMLASSVNHEHPSATDRVAIARVCAYLRGCRPDTGLHYDGSRFDSVIDALLSRAWVDADFKRDGDCRSRTGAVIFMAGAPVFWQSRRQSLVATSSTEAKVVALSEICKPLVWMRHLLSELGFTLPPSPINEDNKAAMILVSTISGSSKSRYFMPRFMLTRSLVEMQVIHVLKIDSFENTADFFTKLPTIEDQKRFINRLVQPL